MGKGAINSEFKITLKLRTLGGMGEVTVFIEEEITGYVGINKKKGKEVSLGIVSRPEAENLYDILKNKMMTL